MTNEDPNNPLVGFRIFRPRVEVPIEGEYGLYLMDLVRLADEEGERVGKFIDIEPLSFEDFRKVRHAIWKRGIYRGKRND